MLKFIIIICVVPTAGAFFVAWPSMFEMSSAHHFGENFLFNRYHRAHTGITSTELLAKSGDDQNNSLAQEALRKTAWYATEAFGKAFGQSDKSLEADADDINLAPTSVGETLRRIRADVVDRSYFLSGEVDRLIYSDDCVFADPFVSFRGRDRFIDNLANLGSFITKYDARLISYDTDMIEGGASNQPTVSTRIMVKLELNLPWKPVLAWPWGVAYTIDPTNFLVTDHIESWDIDPIDGVKQIFRKSTFTIKKSEKE